jgi:hypothetical protein
MEVPLCVKCRKPIDKEEEDYVILNKDEDEFKWQYAHAECIRK